MHQLEVNYGAVLIGSVVGFLLVAVALMTALLLSPRRRTARKGIVYECGMLPVGRYWSQVHIRYYLFAILFIIFDVETVFLFPWVVTFLGIGQTAFYEMVLFIAILALGLIYAWKKGVLQWK